MAELREFEQPQKLPPAFVLVDQFFVFCFVCLTGLVYTYCLKRLQQFQAVAPYEVYDLVISADV